MSEGVQKYHLNLSFERENQILDNIKKCHDSELEKIKHQEPYAYELAMQFPPWNFYKVNGQCARIISIDHIEFESKQDNKVIEEQFCLRTFVPKDDIIEEILGVKPEDVTRVDSWSEDDLKVINELSAPDLFLRKIGFLSIVEEALGVDRQDEKRVKEIEQTL